MRGLGPPYPPLNELRRRATSSGAAIRGEGRAKPSQAKPSQAKRTHGSVRRRSRSLVGTAHMLRTMWAQNTLLIETANACDVTRCCVAMQALPAICERRPGLLDDALHQHAAAP